ncbi:MAG: rRNA maturation RNase YbeY [Spiribacter sp.]|jgi:probable rRNA maturation factor|nr:rRNA maturation RNase YbeY [Spiribacter sp.]MDR9489553.1 rRNA maturation RNase YbeY [Spiribacter sp.]
MLEVTVQHASTGWAPEAAQFETWVAAALLGRRDAAELAIRVVDASESQALNRDYRDKDTATNVLSFPAELPEEVDLALLGDLVICAPIVAREAAEQGKTQEAHWAHLTVHGVLHLLGYDHMTSVEAEHMEMIEREVLAKLGYASPYA